MGFLNEYVTVLIVISVILFLGKCIFDRICSKYG